MMAILARLGLAAAAVFSPSALAEGEERPAGPPWTSTCEPMEKHNFHHVFFTEACQLEFTDFFAAHGVAETHAWMKEHRACFHEWAHFAWLSLIQNDERIAELAWRQQLFMADTRILGNESAACSDHACVAARVRAGLASAAAISEIGAATLAHTNAFLDRVELDQHYAEPMTRVYDAIRPLCLFHLNVECNGAMRQALDYMYPRMYHPDLVPRESFTFSMVSVYRRVFSDAATQRQASALAVRLLDFVETRAYETTTLAAFYSLGLEAFEGDLDRFFDFMIVYATRGAAWAAAYLMVGDDNKAVFVAQMVIASAMGVLDTYYQRQGIAWSYAGTDGFSCYQPKPYHYWMSAGFSYLLRKDGYSERTASLVARLLGALYEVGSETLGRDPDAVFFVPTYDVLVNRQRRELTHQFLGAQFGMHPENPAPQRFDAQLGLFLDSSAPLPELPEDEMRAKIADPLTRWQFWTRLTGFYLRGP